jgi:hypothetical protein
MNVRFVRWEIRGGGLGGVEPIKGARERRRGARGIAIAAIEARASVAAR